MEQKTLEFPCEITFKAIFKNRTFQKEVIQNLCFEYQIEASITEKLSRNKKFISYTIQANFETNDILNNLCNAISRVDGFITMF